MRGTVSWEWKGGGDGNLHSSVVAPMPHGFAAAGIFRRKETATPTRNTSSPAKEMYEPIDATKAGLEQPIITDRDEAFKKASDVASITSTVVSTTPANSW